MTETGREVKRHGEGGNIKDKEEKWKKRQGRQAMSQDMDEGRHKGERGGRTLFFYLKGRDYS